MAEGGKKKSHASSKAELMVKTMVMKKLQKEGSMGDVAGLEDYEIPPEHEELLSGLTKLFKSADRNFLTLAELREFEILLEKKGIVEKGGLLKKGGILEDAGLIRKEDLTEQQAKKARNFSLEEHLRPAKETLTQEVNARKKAMAAGRLAKEKEKEKEKEMEKEREKEKEEGREKEKEEKEKDKAKGKEKDKAKATEEKVKAKEKEKEDVPKGRARAKADERKKKENGDVKPLSKGGDATKKPSNERKEKGEELEKSVVAKTETPTRTKTPPPPVVKVTEEGKLTKQTAADMEEYFRLRRKQALESAAEEEKRDKAKKSGRLVYSTGRLYKEYQTKIGEARKGIGLQKSVSEIKKAIYLRSGVRVMPPIEAENIDNSTDNVSTFRHLLYSSEEVTERPGPDGPGPPVMKYKLALHCLSRGTRETKMLEFWDVPKTGHTIKDRIQRQFQIPISFQHDLTCAGKRLEDSAEIHTIGLKPGGKLELNYLSEGELEEVRVCLKWYEFVLRFGRGRHPSIFTGMPVEYCMICYQGITECLAERLACELMVPWESDIKYANRTYFIQQKGIDVLLDVYEVLLHENWRSMVLRMKLMEAGCIQILAALGASVMNRQKVIAADGHGFVLQSFLRVLVRPRGSPLTDTSGAPGPAQNNNFMLKEVLDSALRFYVNYRECTEVHMDICSKTNAVDQVIGVAHCPSFSVHQAQGCLCLLACSMHSPDTHKWLCRNHTLEGVADCVKVHKERGMATSDDITLLHYYAQVTLAHLVMTSVHVMARKVTEKLVIFMEEFLHSTTPSTILEMERARYPHFGWTPFFPYLKVLLSPPKAKPDVKSRVSDFESVTISRLLDLSMETMLFVLQVKCKASPYKARRQLLEEKVLSYALCLSANVSRRLLPGARIAMSALRSDSAKPVPIPKLNIMARAKLATVYFGLKKVTHSTAEELKLEVSPPPPRQPVSRGTSSTTSNTKKDSMSPLFCIISM